MFRRFILNKPAITADEILKISKKHILENGFSSFNVRAITKECGISIGTLYNYFSSKNDLLIATVESIWQEIFQPLSNLNEFERFVDVVECMYQNIEEGNHKYSGFFSLHNLNFASAGKKEGIDTMNNYFSILKNDLLLVLKNDQQVNRKMFSPEFPEETFVDYIFGLLISSLLKREDSSKLLKFISNYLYTSH